MLQTGTTTAKPVIHGMYGTRVLIMNNGVRQSGQQWGEDHAPEVSVDANDEVHVLKGAEAVAYGSEAIAGVILLGQKSLPYGGEAVGGTLATSYGSNGRRYSGLLKLEGAVPKIVVFGMERTSILIPMVEIERLPSICWRIRVCASWIILFLLVGVMTFGLWRVTSVSIATKQDCFPLVTLRIVMTFRRL